ncbi:MAG: (2Fe-2S)-binding protein [Sphaerochaetaceae bacterium]|nr:(2Fe-2S)-binding protein [Sphaerochaetaceae bacterium]
MAKQLITVTINNKLTELYVDPRESLADMLRNDLKLTSVKHGCDVGECGACTVVIDGENFDSCIYLAIWADGKSITTVEGLASLEGELADIQQAFVDDGAIQCGFCTPGFIMSTLPLLNVEEDLSREEIKKQVSGNFCRCTGYTNIINAIEHTREKIKNDRDSDK